MGVSSLSSPVCPLFQQHKKEKTFQSSFPSHSQHIMWPCIEELTSRTPSLLDSSKDLEAPVLLPPPQLLPWSKLPQSSGLQSKLSRLPQLSSDLPQLSSKPPQL